MIANGFSAAKPISCAQGRYGELIIAQGGGIQPKRWTGSLSAQATNAGIVAPETAPAVTAHATKSYYVARTDVYRPGSCYNSPPAVTYNTNGTKSKSYVEPVAASYLNQSSLGEIVMLNGGKHLPEPPSVTLSGTHGTGAVLTAVMNGPVPDPTSLTQWTITQGPPFDDETDFENLYRTQWGTWGPVDIPITNGSGTVTRTLNIYHGASVIPGGINWLTITVSLSYTISGATGTGAIATVNFYGQGIVSAECWKNATNGQNCFVTYNGSCFVQSVSVKAAGTGYSQTDPVILTIPPAVGGGGGKDLIVYGYPPGHPENTTTPRFAVKSITIDDAGSGYVVPPDIKITSNSGFGAYASCETTNGQISKVTLEAGGGGYKTVPTVTAVSGGAEAFAVARPHLRGKYQCYYRYVDDTAADKGGPIASNLSPVYEVDTGEGTQSIAWSVTAPSNTDGRTLSVELWRTTGNQALTLYRVSSGSNTFTDDLTDEELRNPDRAGYAAMPIVLPNGELNANRFTPPPNNKAVVVRYQDRFWYGVDTSGTEQNSLYFSEVDEPESVPDINEFVLQQNARDGDAVTALVPFGSSLLVMQSRHAYSLSYSKQPLLDANVTPLAYRGCLGQRCWDIHEGICYVLDQCGIYTITAQGGVENISAPIEDQIRTKIDFANATWNFVSVDARTKIMRAFVAYKEDASAGYPTRAICFHIDSKTWWIEKYPHRLSAATPVAMANGDYRCAYGAKGGVYTLDDGPLDAARGTISKVTVTTKGRGYRTPPTVTVTGGSGAELQAAIDSTGAVSGIWIISGGYGHSSGSLTISAPDDPDCASPQQAAATFTATTTASDTATYPTYRYKTGNAEYPTDTNSRSGGSTQSRDISLLYAPQPDNCEVALRLYYNNARYPRFNVAPRNRGVGFVASTVGSASRLDMGALTEKTGADSGVAKALLSGRSIDDIQSSDRHVAVELLGARTTTQPVVFYRLDAYGTSGGEG